MNYDQWKNELFLISLNSINYLENQKKCNECVVVFDIDETLLDLNGDIIEPIWNIYNYCVINGFCIAIITSRLGTIEGVNYTVNQLQSKNIIYNWLYMCKNTSDITNPYIYKETCRKSIYEKGYHIIMSIGDQLWDIGDYGGKGYILPRYIN